MLSQKIAQATDTSTDATLQNLNVKLDLLKEEYNAVASQPNAYSFFNLDNIYFWFVLAGLLLLAFGLLFLLAEIQNKNDKAKISKRENKKSEDEMEEKSQKESEADKEEIKESEDNSEVETLKDLGIDTTEVESELKQEAKKAKKISWFKKEKKVKEVAKVEELAEAIKEKEDIVEVEPDKPKSKGPVKIKVEKIK